jgi:transcriptional regulator with XRE-family HTH domain
LSPAEVGLPENGRRRTPGLRRDEVAELASMSRTYYERLEQQRAPQPSPAVLAALARTLRLSGEEREHLYLLAGQAPPPPDDLPEGLDAGLVTAMESLTATTVAMIVSDLGTVLSQNGLSTEIFGDITDGTGRVGDRAGGSHNFLWRWFTDRVWRESWAPVHTHDTTTSELVADLRAAAAQRGHDATSARLVAELRTASDQFARHWDAHPVSRLRPRFELLRHPRTGTLPLECGVLKGQAPDQRLFLFRAAPGTLADSRLAALARERLDGVRTR